MSDYVIGAIDQIPVGEGRNFQVADTRMAIFRTHAGDVFATQPDCPHLAGPLADGLMGGAVIVCPLHDRHFDLRTGDGPDCRLVTYPVSVNGAGVISVSLP